MMEGASSNASSHTIQVQVLLIHGTGAAAVSDYGARWWQRTSHFQEALQQRLGSSANVQPEGAVFHWSGANSETHRRKAAKRLAAMIREYERAGTPYAIVSHSHGGNIAWRALSEAKDSFASLRNLQALVTVGTPFLQFRTDLSRMWLFMPLLALGIAAAVDFGRFGEIIEAFKSTFPWPEPLMRIGALAVAVAGLIVLACLRYLFLAVTYLREKRYEARQQRLFSLISERTLCMSSPADEAINGLVQSLRFSGHVVPRLKGWYSTPVNIFAQRGDEYIWRALSRKAQGADIPWLETWEVSGCPLPYRKGATLPAGLDERLMDSANRAAHSLVASCRRTMALAAIQRLALPELGLAIGELVTASEVVHCQYFEDDSMVDAIAKHLSQPNSCFEPILPLHSDVLNPKSSAARRNPMFAAFALSIAVLIAGWTFRVVFEPFTDTAQADAALNSAPFREASSYFRTPIGTEMTALDEFLDAVVAYGQPRRALAYATGIEEMGLRIPTLVKLAGSERRRGVRDPIPLDTAMRAWSEWESSKWRSERHINIDPNAFPLDVWALLVGELYEQQRQQELSELLKHKPALLRGIQALVQFYSDPTFGIYTIRELLKRSTNNERVDAGRSIYNLLSYVLPERKEQIASIVKDLPLQERLVITDPTVCSMFKHRDEMWLRLCEDIPAPKERTYESPLQAFAWSPDGDNIAKMLSVLEADTVRTTDGVFDTKSVELIAKRLLAKGLIERVWAQLLAAKPTIRARLGLAFARVTGREEYRVEGLKAIDNVSNAQEQLRLRGDYAVLAAQKGFVRESLHIVKNCSTTDQLRTITGILNRVKESGRSGIQRSSAPSFNDVTSSLARLAFFGPAPKQFR